MECFFLFPGSNLLIIIFDPAVIPFLLFIIPGKGIIKKLVIYVPDIVIHIMHIQAASLQIGIFCMKFTAVMID